MAASSNPLSSSFLPPTPTPSFSPPPSSPVSALRKSTLSKRAEQENKPVVFSGRRILHITSAPTRLQEPHTCKHEPDVAHDKSQRRVTALFIRFAITDLLECKTAREGTHFQTGRSHCGKCECAHSATASSFSDTIMPRVLKDITNESTADDTISTKDFAYLKSRLGIGTPEMKRIESLPKKARGEAVKEKISPGGMRYSYRRTAYEKQLSNTLEGPKASNDFDQSIEKKFRPFEEALCNSIAEGTLNHKVATEKAFDHLVKLMTEGIANLQKRADQLERYYALESELEIIEVAYRTDKKITIEQVNRYTEAATSLMALKAQIIDKMPLCTNFKGGKFQNVANRCDFFCLKGFIGSQAMTDTDAQRIENFKQHMMQDELRKRPPGPGQEALERTKTRLAEGKAQLAGLEAIGKCQLARLDYWLFGITEPSGLRRAPTPHELTLQLTTMTKREAISKARIDEKSE